MQATYVLLNIGHSCVGKGHNNSLSFLGYFSHTWLTQVVLDIASSSATVVSERATPVRNGMQTTSCMQTRF
jgi:hypothetical protein